MPYRKGRRWPVRAIPANLDCVRSLPVGRQNAKSLANQDLRADFQSIGGERYVTSCYNGDRALEFILSIFSGLAVFFRRRSDLALELLALRQQVAVLKRKKPHPRLHGLDRLFWIALRRLWSRWKDVLVIVKPETVIAWHRAGFRLFWRWRSRSRGGRSKITEEILSAVWLRRIGSGSAQDPRRTAKTWIRCFRTFRR